MARRTIRVRNTVTGDVVEIAESALRHFPAFEPIDAPASSDPAAPAADSTPKTPRRAAAKNEEE